jgi:dienelactone hydrolase
MRSLVRAAFVLAALAFPGAALATSAGQPFPTNLDTTPDAAQVTGLRVDLPTAGCTGSDCGELAVLNKLDGFNIQPRISIPFSGPIDLSSVSSSTIFLVGPGGHVVGINQVEWEPAANTLHFESNEQLAQSTTYLLVVSRGVRDANHQPLDATTFRHDLNFGQTKDPAKKAYRKSLIDALPAAMAGGVDDDEIAAASLFTTQSITPIAEKIRASLTGGPVNFNLGTAGERTVFPLASLTSVVTQRQTGTASFQFGGWFLPLFGGVGTVAFGSYSSPNYETSAQEIPATPTRTGVPIVQSRPQVQFTVWLPAGAEPAGGWPVVVFGHGFTDNKDGAPTVVAGALARNGLATIAINVVGHGGGAAGKYIVSRTGASPVVLPLGGRGFDQNNDGAIDSTEGVNATTPLVATRDSLRQTTIDLMQLVKVIEGGVDVVGDAGPDLSRTRIYYAGQSFGGIYGVQLLGLEHDIRAGVPNVPGGPIIEIARLSPSFRLLITQALAQHVPNLLNAPFVAPLWGFDENIPLRNLPIRVDTVPGASAIQAELERNEWVQQSGNPAAYAPYITRPVIIQFARGDQTVPNPTTSAILRAGHLAGRATLFRNDLAYALNPAIQKNPHTFLTNLFDAGAPYAAAAQQQMATFLASDGVTIVDPDGAGPFFETPTSIVPEDTAFIP